MDVVQLARGRRLSSARGRRPLRSGAAIVAASALLLFSACSGEPEVPETVGPTSTPDQPDVFEPTLPPYTSQVELTAEDEEDVEELLLLIDEFTYYTAGITEEHKAGMNRLKGNVGSKLMLLYEDMVYDYEERELSVVGNIMITDASVEEYTPKGETVVATCSRYAYWGPVDAQTGKPVDDKRASRDESLLLKYISDAESGGWIIRSIRYTAKPCDTYEF